MFNVHNDCKTQTFPYTVDRGLLLSSKILRKTPVTPRQFAAMSDCYRCTTYFTQPLPNLPGLLSKEGVGGSYSSLYLPKSGPPLNSSAASFMSSAWREEGCPSRATFAFSNSQDRTSSGSQSLVKAFGKSCTVLQHASKLWPSSLLRFRAVFVR